MGLIPDGGIVERDVSVDLSRMKRISLLLRQPDFMVANETAEAIAKVLGQGVARAVDSTRIEISHRNRPGGIPA